MKTLKQIYEKLSKVEPASDWIKNYISSDNPNLVGKSKDEQVQMALKAFYNAQKKTKVKNPDNK